MANSPVDNGNQIITFAYQQEGTAEGFNKILHGILPRGIISGGILSKDSNTHVYISPMQMLIGDNNVTAHVETGTNAESEISANAPYIVATYTWENITSSYVNFQSMSLADIRNTDNVIILGKGVFDGSSLNGFDYTRKTWTATHYNHDFGWNNQYNTKSPSFNVIPKEGAGASDWTVIVEQGEAIIGGKKVSLTGEYTLTLQNSDSSAENYFNPVISQNCQRFDIVIIGANGIPKYIIGEETSLTDDPAIPICPSDSLVLAILEFLGNENSSVTYQRITGDHIEYIFNDHYYGGSPTVGKKIGNTIDHPNTLFL